MPQQTPSIVEQWFEEIWNQGREERIEQLASPHAILHGLTAADGSEITSRDAFRAFYTSMRTAIPDIHIAIEDVIQADDKVAARCVVTGTHTGNGLGFAPSGQKIRFEGSCSARVANGQIVEAWNHFDFLAFHQQIGFQLVPPTAGR